MRVLRPWGPLKIDRVLIHAARGLVLAILTAVACSAFVACSRNSDWRRANSHTYFNGPRGTLVLESTPGGLVGTLDHLEDADLDTVITEDACFAPAPGTLQSPGAYATSGVILDGYRMGWPWHCLQGWAVWGDKTGRADRHWVLVLHNTLTSLWILPVQPRPLQLAADTAFWALISVGLSAGWRFLRSDLRSALGRCPSCGYTRRGLEPDSPCPECGSTPSKTPSANTAPTPARS